jgi:hypothetical protein
MAAILCFGLRDNSRVKMDVSSTKLTLTETLLARISDDLSFQSWAQTKDGQKNRNRPQSILKTLLEEKKEDKIEAFETPQEFNEAWEKIVHGEHDR